MLAQAIIGSAVNGDFYVPPPWSTESGQYFAFTSDDPSHGFGGSNYWWSSSITGGGAYIFSAVSSPAPTWSSYTYPDTSTGHVLEFTGAEYLISPNLSQVGGTFANNSITVDLWIYPTANNVQLLSEIGEQNESAGYHYSVLEIDSSGYVQARFWSGSAFTSSNQVVLNQWNHIWLVENTSGNHFLQVNGISTTHLPAYYRTSPINSSQGNEYFIIGWSDVTSMVTTNRFQGKFGNIIIRDYAGLSTFSSTKAKYGII